MVITWALGAWQQGDLVNPCQVTTALHLWMLLLANLQPKSFGLPVPPQKKLEIIILVKQIALSGFLWKKETILESINLSSKWETRYIISNSPGILTILGTQTSASPSLGCASAGLALKIKVGHPQMGTLIPSQQWACHSVLNHVKPLNVH